MPFTDKQIAALKPKGGRYEKIEPGRSGLRIRVGKRGEKTWTWVYRFGGAQKRVALGQYPKMGVAGAHEALAAARKKLQAGDDPGAIVAAKRQVERNAETVSELVAEYLGRHIGRRSRKLPSESDAWMLKREIVPEWGSRKAKEITRRDIINLLDEISDRKTPVHRNRVAGVLSRLFMCALDRGIVDASPAIRLPQLEETSRDRFLSADEIRIFWNGLEKAAMQPAVRAALRFLLVTGQRRAEVAGTPETEIDRVDSIWRLSGERTKNGSENLVPLPALALRVIAEADAVRVRPEPVRLERSGRPPYDPEPSQWLFPSYHLGKPLTAASLTRALDRNRSVLGIGDATVHDLRRTFATHHGELGTAPEILSALLNHTPTTITGKVYNRASNIEPRREAMEKWCAWLDRVIASTEAQEKVVPINRARTKFEQRVSASA